ncbi:unnamed protein product [Linum trigynum]|uniref:ARID domain-containing protein n=2 Tax=Linum trigynum TaxID=586398 RepID=A0AAV2DP99_9ROSI
MFASGPCLGSAEVNHKQKTITKHVANDIVVTGNNPNDDDVVKLRKLFDEAFSVFYDLGYNNGESIKPVQGLLGDGQPIDLFKLFYVVGNRGGFDLVNGWWQFVMEELRMDPKYSGCIKLVYFKYLYNLEKWLTQSYSYCEQGSDSGNFSVDLETKFRSVLAYEDGKKNGRVASLELKKSGEDDDDDEDVSGGYKSYVDGDAYYLAQKESRKRKRVSLSEMLSWMARAAACPDAVISKSNHTVKDNDLKAMAIKARDFLLRRKPVDSNVVQNCSKNQQKMHPSMYDDIKVDQAVEKPRCRGRQPTSKAIVPIPVRVGARFQAKVPKWTGEVYESDSKWLGTTIWPVEDANSVTEVQKNLVGKGRPDSCSCLVPNSVGCVRFHIAERRMELKRELGPAFFKGGFNHMGEELSLSWTAEEEQRFMDMVRDNPPSQDKCFWDYAHRYFPQKTKQEMVSYYFNVFQVRRRSYQNRVTPKEIDSDDDENPFGSFTDGFGYDAIDVGARDVCLVNRVRNEYP